MTIDEVIRMTSTQGELEVMEIAQKYTKEEQLIIEENLGGEEMAMSILYNPDLTYSERERLMDLALQGPVNLNNISSSNIGHSDSSSNANLVINILLLGSIVWYYMRK